MSSKDLKSNSSEKIHEVVDSEASHELPSEGETHLKRTLKNRHIAMIR